MEQQSDLSIKSQSYLNQMISDELPILRNEIMNESSLRKEIEIKIEDQFNQQLNELKFLCEEERNERESKEEELVSTLKGISLRVQEAIVKGKKQRFYIYNQDKMKLIFFFY